MAYRVLPNFTLHLGVDNLFDQRYEDVVGFPAPGDPYWNAQTIADVGTRYPNMDMAPYTE